MPRISEYEFNAEKSGKKMVIQQSGFTKDDAEKRIHDKDKSIIIGKLRKRLVYPHKEGGKRV